MSTIAKRFEESSYPLMGEQRCKMWNSVYLRDEGILTHATTMRVNTDEILVMR